MIFYSEIPKIVIVNGIFFSDKFLSSILISKKQFFLYRQFTVPYYFYLTSFMNIALLRKNELHLSL